MTGTVASTNFSKPGANPYAIHSGVGEVSKVPGFKLGDVLRGDAGAEFIFCKFTASGSTTLVDGSAFTVDKNFVATLLTTSNSPFGSMVGIGRAAGVVADTVVVYLWLQIHGEANVLGKANAVAATSPETSATAGAINAPASHTTGAKTINNMVFTTTVGGSDAASDAFLNYPSVGVTN